MSNKVDKEGEEVVHSYGYYMLPSVFTKIASNRKLIFGGWCLIGYIGQFLLIVMCINDYSDGDRHIPCGGHTSADATTVFDTPLLILAIYHLIEWVRVIIFAVCVLIGSNLMIIWYITTPNAIFGLICYIWAHVVRFSDEGKDCADMQLGRGKFLLGDVIVFWLTFFFQQFPQIFLFFLGKEKIEDTLKEAENGGGDDD